jgi:CheY-like chemotaxis protein
LLVVDLGLADGLNAPIGPGPRLPRVVIRPVDAEGGGLEPCADPTVGEPVRRSALQEAILQALRPGEIAAASAPPGSSLPQFGLSVLLAEDYETNRELVGQMIRLLGCRVDTVADGAQAVDAVRMRRYDLILMDLELPVLDGLQATVEIRGQERQSGRRTPVFAFTAHALEEDRQRCLAMGMDGVLTKPLRLATLCGFLSDFREARRRPAELLTS